MEAWTILMVFASDPKFDQLHRIGHFRSEEACNTFFHIYIRQMPPNLTWLGACRPESEVHLYHPELVALEDQ